MSLEIRYFRDGEEQDLESTPPGDLEAIKKVAAESMVRHGMDCAVITDPTGIVVWAGINDAPAAHHPRGKLAAFAQRIFGWRRPAK